VSRPELDLLVWGTGGNGVCLLLAAGARRVRAGSHRVIAALLGVALVLTALLAALATGIGLLFATDTGYLRLATPGTDRHWVVRESGWSDETSYTFYVGTNPVLFRKVGSDFSPERNTPFSEGRYTVGLDGEGRLTLTYPRGAGPFPATLDLEP